MASRLKLRIAIADYPHVSGVRSGAIPIAGVDADFVDVRPQIAAFRRMVRDLEFDVCELAPTTYLIARSFGVPIVALPIFVMRRFHHSGFLVRPDANVNTPKDLEGKRVGVRAWSVTTGVWTRSVLMDDYGVDISKITWVVDDEEHVTQMRLPPNVVHAPAGRSLVDLMEAGDIVAGFDGNAGVGRAGSPTGGWRTVDSGAAGWPELFPDAVAREAEWHRRTGIYPMHGTIVVKEAVLDANPWLAGALYEAFARAKSDWLAQLASGEADTANDRKYAALREIVGADPLPYGFDANMATIVALENAALAQGLITQPIPFAQAWRDPHTA